MKSTVNDKRSRVMDTTALGHPGRHFTSFPLPLGASPEDPPVKVPSPTYDTPAEEPNADPNTSNPLPPVKTDPKAYSVHGAN
jgi:hypothetical protein